MKRTVLLVSALVLGSAAAQAAVLVHGHRGTRGTRPENTLPAFEEALRAGVDVLELDLAVTADNVVVVSHEPEITPERCLGPGGKKLERALPIRSLKLSEVRKFDCGSLPHPGFPRQVPAPGAKIPALDEVFELVEKSGLPAAVKVGFNMETKIFPSKPQLTPSPAAFAALVAGAIARHGMEKRTIVQSFDVRTLREMKKLAPAVRTSQLTYEDLTDIVPSLKSSRTDIWSPDHEWLLPEFVAEAHAAGIQVAPWTLNTPAAWDAAIAAGVDAIITDYPADLIEHLKAKKLR